MSCFSGSRLIKILTGYSECENLLDLTWGPLSEKAVYQDLADKSVETFDGLMTSPGTKHPESATCPQKAGQRMLRCSKLRRRTTLCLGTEPPTLVEKTEHRTKEDCYYHRPQCVKQRDPRDATYYCPDDRT